MWNSKGSPSPQRLIDPKKINTGGEIDSIVLALVNSANDNDENVRKAITSSLHDIGFRQPGLVLSSCGDFLRTNSKADRAHRIILLNIIHRVLEVKRDDVPEEFLATLVELCIAEMTKEKDVLPDWQGAASADLVSLGMRLPNQVFDELMKRFEIGTLPHYFVMKTLGDLVATNSMATVPRVKEVLSRILPVLSSIKHENIKWVFAATIWNFCEGILHYVANVEDNREFKDSGSAPLSTASFSSDVFPAYELMLSKWLGSNEPKVRLATVQAVGSMCAILSKDQFEAQAPKVIPAIISMYKKEKDFLPITQSLCSVLETGVRCGGTFKTALDPLLPTVLNTIHTLIMAPPDYNNSTALKNYNEILRCFEIIGRGFSDSLITFLMQRLEQREPRVRCGALGVIRHLVTRLATELDDKKGLLVSAVKPLVLGETVLSVKKQLAQVVIAMASHGYLNLEGGENLVEFIIRGSSYVEEPEDPKKKKKENSDPEGVTEVELRNLCDNILHLLTTTIPSMDPVLWPYLFESLVPSEYTGALAVVSKCITHLATNKRQNESEDYIIDFDRAVNLPKPSAIMARLFVCLNSPFRRQQLGIRILELLRSIGPILHPSICTMWDVTLPKMVTYIEENGGPDWNKESWEELVLRLLTESIKIANDDEWNVALGNSISDQLAFYKGDPELKRTGLKMIGLLMQKSTHKEFLRTKLDVIFQMTEHTNPIEADGAATAYGYCSSTHLDLVLEKLNALVKICMSGKKGGFSFGKSKAPGIGKGAKNTIVLSLGSVAAYASYNLISSRVEVHIINPIKAHLTTVKSIPKKVNAIKALDLIGKAMHPSHLQSDFIFKQRDEMLKIIMNYMTPTEKGQIGTANPEVRIKGLGTCSTLIRLEPPLPLELETALITSSLNFFTMPPDGENDANLAPLWDALNTTLSSILFSQTSITTLCRLFSHLETWTRSKESHHRERSIGALLNLAKKFVEFTVDEEKVDKVFTNLGHALAVLVPRCTDPLENVRKNSVESIQLLVYIDYMLQQSQGGKGSKIKPPDQLQPLTPIKDRIGLAKENNEQFALVHETAKVEAFFISKEELPKFVLTSLAALTDSQPTSTNGTCVVLNTVFKLRGEEMLPQIPQVIKGILEAMEGIQTEATMNGTLHALRSLATHHLLDVVDQLLDAPMPHSQHVIKSFQVVAKDRNLVMGLLQHLTDIINNKALYDEKPNPKDKKQYIRDPLPLPMAATCALGEIMQSEELEDVINSHYPQFLGSLLLRIGTANGNQPKTIPPPASKPKDKPTIISPSQQIVASFRQFVERSKDDVLKEALEANNNWARLEGPDFYVAIAEITAAFSKSHPDQMRGIFEFLFPYLRGNYIPQRIVACSVYAEFLSHSKEDKELLNKLLNCLLTAQADPTIKLVALRGLGNIVASGPEQTNRYAQTVIDSLVSSIDDVDEIIAMESMMGLSRVFEVVDEARVAPILVNICLRIRPAFEKTNDDIRAASFTLFGTLWRFGQQSAADVFHEQMHYNLPSIVLHVNDDNPKVQSACKLSLRRLGPLFRSEEINQFFSNKKFDPDRPLEYDQFLDSLSSLLIQYFPERMNYYVMTSVDFYRSSWNSIRANAAVFTGVLLGNLPPEKRKGINLNPAIVTKALIGLLTEKSVDVRKKAAEALSLLYTY